MADHPMQNRPLRQLTLVVSIVGLVSGVLLASWGAYALITTDAKADAGLLLAAGFILSVFSMFLYALTDVVFKAEGHASRLRTTSDDLVSMTRRLEPLIKTIADNSQISDATRSIANREIEREALRQAIREEMYGGELEVAQYLVTEMERRFGYAQEAKKLGEELAQVREMTIEEKINEAISHIHKLMDEHRWTRAGQESNRLIKLFPRHERVASLPADLHRRREVRKQELLKEWKVVVDREEVDRGIAVLTELDQYLTPQEAQSLQDSVRHVFKTRLVNLGVRFGLAASDNRWRDALTVGLQIRKEFPNSRMAREVAQNMETLRLRAGFLADADIVQQREPQQ